MLVFNLLRVLEMKGITNPLSFFSSIGYSRWTAYRMMRNDFTSFTPDKIERICFALNCTPNDLFQYKSAKGKSLPENHALHALVRADADHSVKDILQGLPLETIIEMVEQAKKK